MDKNLSDISNLFIWKNRLTGRKYSVSISRTGVLNLERLTNPNELYSNFQSRWEEWSRFLTKVNSKGNYTVPSFSFVDRIKQILWFFVIQCCVIFLFAIINLKSTFDSSLAEQNWNGETSFFLFLLGGVTLAELIRLWFFISRSYYKIIIENDFLKITSLKGQTNMVPLSEICDYNFKIVTRNAFVKFKDGTKLTHLERLTDWPILRNDLKIALEGKN